MTFDKDELGLPWKAAVHSDPQWAVGANPKAWNIVCLTSQRDDELRAKFIAEAANQYHQMREALERIATGISPDKPWTENRALEFQEIATESLNQLTQGTK